MSNRIQNVRPQERNGIKYRSTLEAETAKVLSILKIPFQYETKIITLQDGFRCPYQKDKVRALTYTPDFIIDDRILIECKGFETPEWRIKKKLVFKYLQEKEPNTFFYQIHDSKKDLLQVLDKHWLSLGYAIKVTKKPTKKKEEIVEKLYDSISVAMKDMELIKPIGAIMKSLTGDKQWVYGYNWKLNSLKF